MTLFEEINALGGTTKPGDERAAGRMENLDEVLAILNRRGFTEQSDAIATSHLRAPLEKLLHAACDEKGFASAVRNVAGLDYPFPGLDIAEEEARAALGEPAVYVVGYYAPMVGQLRDRYSETSDRIYNEAADAVELLARSARV